MGVHTTIADNQPNLPKEATALLKQVWESQLILSFLLALLVLVYFILPVAGVGSSRLQIYTDVAFSLVLIFGIALTWGRNELFAIAASVRSCALAFRWLAWFVPTQR